MVRLIPSSPFVAATLLTTSPLSSSLTLSNYRSIGSSCKYLSSSAATFLTSVAVLVIDPTSGNDSNDSTCTALPGGTNSCATPRYIEKEINMSYGGDNNNNPRTRGMIVKRFTGDSTPYSFPVRPVRLVKDWPKDNPPFIKEDFTREDENDDNKFYTIPKLLYHIDEPAVSALTQYYRNNMKPGSDILDICSSWVSHYPVEFPKIMNRISGSGISSLELKFNDQLTDYEAKNLNKDPTLPYDDESFDYVTCVVSIDYLIKPIEVLKEVHRVLRPGGKVFISQSNRCFPTKAINMWLQMNDRQHLELINAFFQYAGGYDEPRNAYDITASDVPAQDYPNDPMFIVEATKSTTTTNETKD